MSLNFGGLINKLVREINQTQLFLKNFSIRPGHAVLDHTVARYIWGAIAVADLVLIIAKDRRYIGAEPLIRQLLETCFTLKHLLNTTSPDEAAVRALVWELINEEKKNNIPWPKVLYSIFKLPDFNADQAIEELCAELESIQEPCDLVTKIYSEAKESKKRHWHWTGKGPGAMIHELGFSEPDAIVDALETKMFRLAWAEFSSESHATPRWRVPGITFIANGVFDFDDPLARDNQKAARLAGIASHFLEASRDLVAEYYGISKKE